MGIAHVECSQVDIASTFEDQFTSCHDSTPTSIQHADLLGLSCFHSWMLCICVGMCARCRLEGHRAQRTFVEDLTFAYTPGNVTSTLPGSALLLPALQKTAPTLHVKPYSSFETGTTRSSNGVFPWALSNTREEPTCCLMN
ncbi:hypothetical protein JOB18_019656 [Solea senegalensis]|uniref:Uncharacterized protein n=1 Tax=Solea senegalensis TaxID=28829 RepID=A0AAV6R2C6_SOLSE|nr:hypothetical protein JOB18_019656 [Solea senegalensis]